MCLIYLSLPSFFLLLFFLCCLCLYHTKSSIATKILAGIDGTHRYRTTSLHIDSSRSFYFHHQFSWILWSHQRIPRLTYCLWFVHHHYHPSSSCPDCRCCDLQSRSWNTFEKVLTTYHNRTLHSQISKKCGHVIMGFCNVRGNFFIVIAIFIFGHLLNSTHI